MCVISPVWLRGLLVSESTHSNWTVSTSQTAGVCFVCLHTVSLCAILWGFSVSSEIQWLCFYLAVCLVNWINSTERERESVVLLKDTVNGRPQGHVCFLIRSPETNDTVSVCAHTHTHLHTVSIHTPSALFTPLTLSILPLLWFVSSSLPLSSNLNRLEELLNNNKKKSKTLAFAMSLKWLLGYLAQVITGTIVV